MKKQFDSKPGGLARGLLILLLSLVATIAAPRASGAQVGEPDVKGDQLVFIFDARAGRTSFLAVSNPGDATVFVDVAFFGADVTPLVRQTLQLASNANVVIDPTTFGSGEANGSAGLVFVTPVTSINDPQPVVPPEPLTGGFTLANVTLGSGFGQNPFGRLAVNTFGLPVPPGTEVDGTLVSYERFTPDSVMVPTYFDPATLGPPENDGNRILLASFTDQYGPSFGVAARAVTTQAIFFDSAGSLLATEPLLVDGVLLTDLQSVAGATNLNGSSGKVYFDVDAGEGNFFGLFGQSVGTFAAGQRMPAVASRLGCTIPDPVVLNDGQATTWTVDMTTFGNASFPRLQVRLEQSGSTLSGSNRDNQVEVDVESSGTIDGCGDVALTSTVTNGGSPRAVITFTGSVSGSGSNQVITGEYSAVGPSISTPPEVGIFEMDHN